MVKAPFSAAHCRAARALLGWTQEQLAVAADVNRMTVKRLEKDEVVRPAMANAIRDALAEADVLFFGEGERCGDATVTLGVALAQKVPV